MLREKARCAICGRQITKLEARLYQTCDFWKCRLERRSQQRALRREKLERERRRTEELRRRLRRLRDEVAGSLGIDDPESFVPANVLASQRPVTDLSPHRRRALRDHLMQLTSEASEQRSASSPGPPQVEESARAAGHNSEDSPISASTCAICEGRCCTNGEDHAYLDAPTIRRYMDEHPSERPRDVVEAFLSRVANRTYQDSCIYHGESGCGLPFTMRSRACTAFECTELRQMKEEFSGRGPHRVFVAAMDGDQPVRFAFVHVDNHLNQACFRVISDVSRLTGARE